MIKAKRIAKLAGNVLLCVIVAAAVLLLVFYAFAGSGRSMPGGVRPLIVLSGSMEPKMPVGSVVVAKSTNPTSLKVGDIVTYFRAQANGSSTGVLVTHRIKQVVGSGSSLSFITQGDANNTPDGTPVLASQVVGRVFLIVPYAGYVTRFVRTPLGLILLILLPAAILIAGEVRNVFKGKAKPLKGSGTMVLMVGLVAVAACLCGNSGAEAYFATTSSAPVTFSTGAWDTPNESSLCATPGHAKAVRTSKVPCGPASFQIASVDQSGVMKLDFGEVSPGNTNNSPDVFRIKNTGTSPVEIKVEGAAGFEDFVVRVRLDNHDSHIVLKPGQEVSVEIKLGIAHGTPPDDYQGVIRISLVGGSSLLDIPALVTVTGKGGGPKKDDISTDAALDSLPTDGSPGQDVQVDQGESTTTSLEPQDGAVSDESGQDGSTTTTLEQEVPAAPDSQAALDDPAAQN